MDQKPESEIANNPVLHRKSRLIADPWIGRRLYGIWGRVGLDQLPLTDAEIDGLPTLIRLARAIGLVWWIGRQRLGLSRAADTAARVRRLMDVDGWLRDHAVELTAELRSAGPSR